MPGALDVVATDGLRIIGTVGFFLPAAVLVALVVGAVVRDRRLSAREAQAEAEEPGRSHEALGDYEGIQEQGIRAPRERPTPPRAD